PPVHVERQPVLRGELPHAEVPTRHARPARLGRARAPGRARARRLVQRRALPRRPRAHAPCRRALQPHRRHRGRTTTCARRRPRRSPRAIRGRSPDPEGATACGVDQPAGNGGCRSVIFTTPVSNSLTRTVRSTAPVRFAHVTYQYEMPNAPAGAPRSGGIVDVTT